MAIWRLLAFYGVSIVLSRSRERSQVGTRRDLLMVISWIDIYHYLLKLVSSFLPSAKSSLKWVTHLKNVNGHSIKELMGHNDREYIVGYSLAYSPLPL
jgi:hypothetical protein